MVNQRLFQSEKHWRYLVLFIESLLYELPEMLGHIVLVKTLGLSLTGSVLAVFSADYFVTRPELS